MANAETHTLLTGGRCMEVEGLTDRLNAPV